MPDGKEQVGAPLTQDDGERLKEIADALASSIVADNPEIKGFADYLTQLSQRILSEPVQDDVERLREKLYQALTPHMPDRILCSVLADAFDAPDAEHLGGEEGLRELLEVENGIPSVARAKFFDVLAESSLDEALEAAFVAAAPPRINLSGDPHKAAQLNQEPDQPKDCEGSGEIPTGECRDAMSGPTCFNPTCPPCQTPETDSCPGCSHPDCPNREQPKELPPGVKPGSLAAEFWNDGAQVGKEEAAALDVLDGPLREALAANVSPDQIHYRAIVIDATEAGEGEPV